MYPILIIYMIGRCFQYFNFNSSANERNFRGVAWKIKLKIKKKRLKWARKIPKNLCNITF